MTGGVVIGNYPTTFGYYGYFSGNPSLTPGLRQHRRGRWGRDLFVFLGNGVFEGNLDTQNAIANNFRAQGSPPRNPGPRRA